VGRILLVSVLLAGCARPAGVARPSAPMTAPSLSAPILAAEPQLVPPVQPQIIEDGHTRPRALAMGARDGLLYVAATTANRVYVIDPDAMRVRAALPVGRFPDTLLPLADGRVAVVPRYDVEVGLIEPGTLRYRTVFAGPEAGHRGLAHLPGAHTFYLVSPALGAIKVYREGADGRWQDLQRVAAGLSPRVVRIAGARLYATDFLGHTVTSWALEADGRVGARVAEVHLCAPPTDVVPVRDSLWVLTHEDREVDRRHVTVNWLDSVLIELDAATLAKRAEINVTELPGRLTAKLDGIAFDPATGVLAVSGGASDDLLWFRPGLEPPQAARAQRVGANPQGVAIDARGRIWTADRLSDALSVVDPRSGAVSHLSLGERPVRRTLGELGEVLYYSRDLVPHNVPDGPLSVYACSACHEEAHVDGRLHPARKNRFRSMTKTDRGVATTPPYLSLGELANLTEFADNIISSHAQGWERDPDHYDRYSVQVRTSIDGYERLDPDQTRRAMAAYLAVIPNEPNPLVGPSGRFSPAAERGAQLFQERCTRCHLAVGNVALGNRVPRHRFLGALRAGEVALAGAGLYDVGTPVLGKGGNNPPSLRGIWSTPPYFSDGSARTLAEVVARTNVDVERVHAPQNRSGLDAQEQRDLVEFLRSL
jgi:DNA-binding beta-propeller fold protein YncE